MRQVAGLGCEAPALAVNVLKYDGVLRVLNQSSRCETIVWYVCLSNQFMYLVCERRSTPRRVSDPISSARRSASWI